MASLNLAGKTSGYVKVTAPDDSSTNPTVVLPTESGELALKSDITGGGGGIPEAPVDGKQYARKDADWSEVEASGGGGTATPPVAFDVCGTTNAEAELSSGDMIVYEKVVTNEGDNYSLADNAFIAKKEGVYNFSASVFNVGTSIGTDVANTSFYVNGVQIDNHRTLVQTQYSTSSNSIILKLNANDKVQVGITDTAGKSKINMSQCSFSGHMVSSITEGEVKEKEAVVVTAKLNAPLPIVTDTWTVLPFNTTHDTNGSYDVINRKFKPSVAGWYQINYQARVDPVGATIEKGNRQCIGIWDKDDNRVAFTSQDFDDTESASTSTISTIVYFDGVSDYIVPQAWANYPVITISAGDETLFSAHLITGQSSGGSGGGDYTPEDMVWETYPIGSDPVTQRELEKVYTNTNDVPLYIDIDVSSPSSGAVNLYIDDVIHGTVGCYNTTAGSSVFDMISTTIPSGSTYSLKQNGSFTIPVSINRWHEARMPVAVGTGSKTVAFRGELSANQTVESTWTKINLDTASIDTDNSLVDGKFKPSVSGYYQVNGAINQDCTPTSSETIASIYKNGTEISQGSYVLTPTVAGSILSNVSDVIYLNGTTDYLELYGYVKSDGSCKILGKSSKTYLSAVLVSGGSASGGDSIVTQEGNEVTVGDISVTKTTLHGKIHLTPEIPTPSLPVNTHISEEGVIFKTTTTYYSTEEVDKKLAVKDKLIEKLSDRLDKLEKKLKKAK